MHQNKVYETLVTSESDLVGAVAYAFYKSDKRDFILKENLPPNHPEISNYHKHLGPAARTALRERAKVALDIYTTGVAKEAAARAKTDILAAIDRTEALVLSRTRFWSSVFASVVATVILALGLSVAAFLNREDQNPLGTLYKLFSDKYELRAKTP